MRAIEFYGKIKNKVITIPDGIENIPDEVAHIIVLINEQNAAKKNRLKKLFKKLSEKDIFLKIKNPVEWQKKIRNEW